MRPVSRFQQRQALFGWVKWAPVLVILFTPLFIDTWISVQKRHTDYELATLKGAYDKALVALREVRDKEVALKSSDGLSRLAEAMDMRKANPQQQIRMPYSPEHCRFIAPEESMALARRSLDVAEQSAGVAVVDSSGAMLSPPVVAVKASAPAPEAAPAPREERPEPVRGAVAPAPLAIPEEDFGEEFDLDASLGNLLESL